MKVKVKAGNSLVGRIKRRDLIARPWELLCSKCLLEMTPNHCTYCLGTRFLALPLTEVF